jgi:hypothetical protein
MARREVTRQDAVVAVAVMDCSAGPASILGLCATSSSFAARPDQEPSAKQERMVLAALGLAHSGLLLEDGGLMAGSGARPFAAPCAGTLHLEISCVI